MNHHYEPLQMPTLPAETRQLPLRGRVSRLPRTAQAQSRRALGAKAKGGEAKLLARAEPREVHPLCGDVPLSSWKPVPAFLADLGPI